MFIIYKLTFDDESIYIGQTRNLNDRLQAHKIVWKKSYGLSVVRVDVLEVASTRREALNKESAHIKTHTYAESRNRAAGIHNTEAFNLAEKIVKEMNPTEPLHLLKLSSSLAETERIAYVRKKITQLENRYIRLFFQLETMKKNIEDIDALVEQAMERED